MAVAYVNGHSNGHSNGHNKHDTEPFEFVEPDPPKPCCERLGYGSWCSLPDGHAGEHAGAHPQYGPIEQRPALWREHKGQVK
jgi:hypothetical protein